MTSRGSRRLLLSGNELKERGRREAPLLHAELAHAFTLRVLCRILLWLHLDKNSWALGQSLSELWTDSPFGCDDSG